nr:MAG TPA: hypothetical protein [Caudoviricetes sp.]
MAQSQKPRKRRAGVSSKVVNALLELRKGYKEIHDNILDQWRVNNSSITLARLYATVAMHQIQGVTTELTGDTLALTELPPIPTLSDEDKAELDLMLFGYVIGEANLNNTFIKPMSDVVNQLKEKISDLNKTLKSIRYYHRKFPQENLIELQAESIAFTEKLSPIIEGAINSVDMTSGFIESLNEICGKEWAERMNKYPADISKNEKFHVQLVNSTYRDLIELKREAWKEVQEQYIAELTKRDEEARAEEDAEEVVGEVVEVNEESTSEQPEITAEEPTEEQPDEITEEPASTEPESIPSPEENQ